MKQQFVIKDWANNLIKFKGRPYIYETFEDAEDVLSEELGDNYDADRGEYEIEQIEGY